LQAGQALQLWFNLFSRRYMAGRVSRSPGDDEHHLQQALAFIKQGGQDHLTDSAD
jgi:hypothetical protein